MVQAATRVGKPTSEFLQWPDFDRDLVVALGRVERNTGQYGEWLPDATSVRADPEYYEDDAIRYMPAAHTNYAAKAARDAEDAAKKAEESGNFNGKFWSVELREFGTPESGS